MTIIYPARLVRVALERQELQNGSDEPDSTYWKAVWDAVSDDTPSVNNLRNFDLWIRVHVITGGLQATKALGQRVQQLAEEGNGMAEAAARDQAWDVYIRELAKRFFTHLTRGAARMY